MTTLPLKTRHDPDQRLEQLDYEAGLSLLYDYIQTTWKLVFDNVGTEGLIIRGFNYTQSGQYIQFLAELGIAVDHLGQLVVFPGTSTYNVDMSTAGTYVLHAYVVDVDIDNDGRRRWNRSAATEEAYNTYTRKIPTFGIHVASSIEASAFVQGQTVALVPLYRFTTTGGGTPTITEDDDYREFWGEGRASSFTFPTGNQENSHGIYGLRTLVDAFSKRLQEIHGASWIQGSTRDVTTIDAEILTARVPLEPNTAAPASSLQVAIHHAKSAQITVGDGIMNSGDYIGGSGLGTALNLNDDDRGGRIQLKSGFYGSLPVVTLSQRQGVHIQGVPSGINATPFSPSPLSATTNNGSMVQPQNVASNKFTLSLCKGVLIENLYFDLTGNSNAWHFEIFNSEDIRFVNCVFKMSNTNTSEMFRFTGTNQSIEFNTCSFISEEVAQPFFDFTGDSTSAAVAVNHFHLNNCYFKVKNPIVRSTPTGTGGGVFSEEFTIKDCDIELLPLSGSTFTVFDFNRESAPTTAGKFGLTVSRNHARGLHSSAGTLFDCRVNVSIPNNEQTLVFTDNQFTDLGRVLHGRAVNSHFVFSRNTWKTSLVLSDTEYAVYVEDSSGGNGEVWPSIEGNRFEGGGTGGGVWLNGDSVILPERLELFITDNRFTNLRYGVRAEEVTALAIRINSNDFNDISRQPIFVRLHSGVSTTYGGVLQIKNNIIDGGGNDTTVITYGSVLPAQNEIAAAIGVDSTLADESGSFETVDISDNTVQNWANTLVAYASAGVLAGLPSFYNVSMVGNKLKNVGNSNALVSTSYRQRSGGLILVHHYENSTRKNFVRLSENQITRNGWGVGIFYDFGNDGGTPNSGVHLEGLEICGNSIDQSNTPSESGGIKVGNEFTRAGWSTNTTSFTGIRLLRCNNNTVSIGPQSGTTYAEGAIDLATDAINNVNDWSVDQITLNSNVILTNAGGFGSTGINAAVNPNVATNHIGVAVGNLVEGTLNLTGPGGNITKANNEVW